jgi:hypothetical protein
MSSINRFDKRPITFTRISKPAPVAGFDIKTSFRLVILVDVFGVSTKSKLN